MKSKMVWLKLAAAFLLLLIFTAAAYAADTPAKPAYCATPEFHQFDFWIGDWDAYDMDEPAKVQARAHVDSTLNGCVLFEDYQQIDGLHGQSFNNYDASRKVWHESWVTNGGSLMLLEGNMRDGAMVLSGTVTKNGHEVLIRDTWKVADGIVRETAVKSTDGGKTWETLFDMGFRPHKETASLNDDKAKSSQP